MPNSLELRFRGFAARTRVRRIGVLVLALIVSTDLAIIAPVLIHARSRRAQIALVVVWCLGVAALLMLVRLWGHITRDTVAAHRDGV